MSVYGGGKPNVKANRGERCAVFRERAALGGGIQTHRQSLRFHPPQRAGIGGQYDQLFRAGDPENMVFWAEAVNTE